MESKLFLYQSFPRKSSAGFSLTEMSVVLALIGIVTAIAVPLISTHIRTRNLSQEALALRFFLETRYARALGYRERIDIELSKLSVRSSVSPGLPPETYTFKRGVTLRLRPNQATQLRFNPSISATPATLTLELHGQICDVVISLRGRIRCTC